MTDLQTAAVALSAAAIALANAPYLIYTIRHHRRRHP